MWGQYQHSPPHREAGSAQIHLSVCPPRRSLGLSASSDGLSGAVCISRPGTDPAEERGSWCMRSRQKAETHPRNPQPFPGFQQPPGHSWRLSRSHWEDGARGQEDQGARRGWPCQLDPPRGPTLSCAKLPGPSQDLASHCQAHGPLPGLWALFPSLAAPACVQETRQELGNLLLPRSLS